MPRSWSITSTAASAQWCPRHCGWTVQREFSAPTRAARLAGRCCAAPTTPRLSPSGFCRRWRNIATRYDAADFRPTPDLFNGVENVALQYAFTYLGYTQQTELSTWVPVAGRTPETLLASFRQNKKQDVKKALKQDLTFRKLETRAEIDAFHALLRQNLQKFGVEPVHTADELWEFKTSRLPNIAGFYGVFADEQMVAGGMTFYFAQANVLHTQYLAADLSIRSYSPAAYLYYRMLCLAAGMGCNALSWGISTEERGKVLNFGLVESKEGYASCHAVNLGFTKTFSKKETNDAT